MTYVRSAAEIMSQVGLVKLLVEVCRVAQKEKVFRMALASMRNLLTYEDLGLASDMVEAGLNKVGCTRCNIQHVKTEVLLQVTYYLVYVLKVPTASAVSCWTG